MKKQEKFNHSPTSKSLRDILKHYLGDIVYGASDGIITTFAVVSSITGAKVNPVLIIILGFANLIADGFSMAASRYLSIRAKSEVFGTTRGHKEPLKHAAFTFCAFITIGGIPVFAYLFPLDRADEFFISSIMTGTTLFFVGTLQAYIGKNNWFKSGLEVLIVGTLAATVAYGIGQGLSEIEHIKNL